MSTDNVTDTDLLATGLIHWRAVVRVILTEVLEGALLRTDPDAPVAVERARARLDAWSRDALPAELVGVDLLPLVRRMHQALVHAHAPWGQCLAVERAKTALENIRWHQGVTP